MRPQSAAAVSPVEHLRLPESIYQLLRRRILNNDLGAGTRLVEMNLAADLGVSRSTIGLALGWLSQEGLVEIRPRGHSFVTRMSHEEIDDAYYARYILEEGALRAVADARLDSLTDQLAGVVDRMAVAARGGDLAALVDLDTEYHVCIVRESGKRHLLDLWETLNGQMDARMRSSTEDQHVDLLAAERRHADLTEVIRGADRTAIGAQLYQHYLAGPSWIS